MKAQRCNCAHERKTIAKVEEAVDLRSRVDRHPYGTVAAAVGIGYVLGGGLFTSLTARLVRTGLRLAARLAVIPVLERELVGLAESMVDRKSQPSARAPARGHGETDDRSGDARPLPG
jgi:hypothetical protein